MSKDDGKIEITSINQSGGITAHTVNFAPAARHVDDNVRAQLKAMIPVEVSTEVEVVDGDPEALRFAQEISAFLQSQGYPISAFARSMFPGPVVGQQCTRREDGSYHVLIGSRS